jgi:protein-L-isoaspartate O-methyltransferase
MKHGSNINSKIYRYNFLDILVIKKTNLFWKVVDYLSYKLEKLGNLYEKTISKNYVRESEIFDISESKNILHIGCGAYPITTITLAKFNGGNIVGIDKNQKAVEKADYIIRKKGFIDRVKIEKGSGECYPVDKFDAIIVSSCSTPKSKILEHLFNSAKPDCKIIIRESVGPGKLVSTYIDAYDGSISFINKIHNYNFPTFHWDSFYLLKK